MPLVCQELVEQVVHVLLGWTLDVLLEVQPTLEHAHLDLEVLHYSFVLLVGLILVVLL